MARDLADPPDIPPERLWRSLLPLRPERRIQLRLRGAPHIPLIVRAIPAMAELLARDAGHAAGGDVEQLQGVLAAREVLSLVLHTPAGRPFPSSAAMRGLDEHELAQLTRAAYDALADIAPTCARSNGKVWREQLLLGAKHDSNISEAGALATCVDLTPEKSVPRPDRYWGVPLIQLLDGHWMAYQAARDALRK